MRIDILTIFPQLFGPFLTHGMVERARHRGRLEVRLTDLRCFTEDRHRSVDDRPYGGGPGMLLKPEPVFRALDLLDARDAVPILLCPQGRTLDQAALAELSREQHLLLLCGRYEGFDERIVEAFPWRRYSIGEYVLSGGEAPAMVIVEGVARLLPGVLGHEESHVRDSFSEGAGPGGLDHPHYTRPPEYRGRAVPEVLLSGNHGEIESWRRDKASGAAKRREARDSENRNPSREAGS